MYKLIKLHLGQDTTRFLVLTFLIEFENGLDLKIKNKTAYVLASLGIIVKKLCKFPKVNCILGKVLF